MLLDSELLKMDFFFGGSSLKTTTDETLFLELALRGYNLSKLRREDPQAEILKLA